MALWVAVLVAMATLSLSAEEKISAETKCPPLHYGSDCHICINEAEVICMENTTYLHMDYRLFLTSKGYQILGHSIFECSHNISKSLNVIIQELVSDIDYLNHQMCAYVHRDTDNYCSRCETGYAPSPYTYYGVPCTKCPEHGNGWLAYIGLELGFPTLLFFFCLLLRVKITSGAMMGFVFYCQVVANTLTDPYYYFVLTSRSYHFTNILFCFYGIWNMDFFRFVIPKFCVSRHLRTLDVVALGYLSAFYPLVLTTVVYLLVKCHHRGCRAVMVIWGPFHSLFISFKNHFLGENSSLVDTFATFLLLSYSKIIFVSLKLLEPLTFYKIYYDSTLHYKHKGFIRSVDPGLKYFTEEHVTYVLLAVIVLVVFTVIPTAVLCLYPTRCGRRLLSRSKITNSTDFNRLVSAFQASFKDGRNGTWDYRLVSTIFVFHRMCLFTLTIYLRSHDFISYYPFFLQAVMYITTFAFFSYAQPHKKFSHTVIDLALLMLLTVQSLLCFKLYGACPYIGKDVDRCTTNTQRYITAQLAILCLPQAVLCYWLLYQVARKLKEGALKTCWTVKNKYHNLLSNYASL